MSERKMTNGELMVRRFMVTGLYPNSPYAIGDILTQWGEASDGENGFVLNQKKPFHYLTAPEKYPTIFREMQWYEQRKVEDMPDYVRCVSTPCPTYEPTEGNVYEVAVWWMEDCGRTKDKVNLIMSSNCYLPATEEEYLNQKK